MLAGERRWWWAAFAGNTSVLQAQLPSEPVRKLDGRGSAPTVLLLPVQLPSCRPALRPPPPTLPPTPTPRPTPPHTPQPEPRPPPAHRRQAYSFLEQKREQAKAGCDLDNEKVGAAMSTQEQATPPQPPI